MPRNDNNWIDYCYNDSPKCPHCDSEINIDDDELYNLYEGGDHEIECSHCEKEISVTTNVSYTFSTSQQED